MTDPYIEQLYVLAVIRAAVGDPTSKLMQDELVRHIAAIVAERDSLRAMLGEAMPYLHDCKAIGGYKKGLIEGVVRRAEKMIVEAP